ncbi:MAG: MotA/TolQ/ExbB proton channel family protein [bacterium]|nr:MAG: MotA/TolQ/ExbB proton channel family protein [bacterium]
MMLWSGKLKKTPFMSKWYYLVVILAILISISTLQASVNLNKGTRIENQTGQSENNENETAESKKLSVWNIIKMTDWLFWPFVIITAAGIMLITYRTLFEHREKSRGQTLLQSQINTKNIRGLVQMAQSNNSTRVSRLMYQILATFKKTRRAEPIGDDINQFLSAERDSFETFNRVNGFLSESAGALGLLGTVWGIFQTFHAGRLDGPTILKGMSISLVTTLVGLIISLILNMGGTYVFTLFNRQLNLLANKAEELRQVLLYLEKKPVNNIQTVSANYNNLRVPEFRYQSKEKSRNQYSDEMAFAEM